MPFDENAPTSPYINLDHARTHPRRFLSIRWQILTPIVAVAMTVLMCGAYGVGYALIRGGARDSSDDLTAVSQSIARNAIEMGRTHRTEVDRIAFTTGVKQGITAGDGVALQPLIEPLAALASLDLVVLGDGNANEVIGMERVAVSGAIDYAVTSDTEITGIAAVQAVLQGADSASTIVSVDRRPMLVTAGPILEEGRVVGIVLVGTDTNRVLTNLKGGNDVDLALFSGSANYLGTTLEGVSTIELDEGLYRETLNDLSSVTFERTEIAGDNLQAAYFPLVIGQSPLGVVAVYQRDETRFASEFARQIMSLFFAAVVAAISIAGFAAVGRQVARVERIRDTIDQLASGKAARSGMKPTDEIGALGVAVDRYAAAAQAHVRQVQHELRQQRRQSAHLQAILESLPDGVVVQDAEGRVSTMNATARDLLGIYGDTPGVAALREWTGSISQQVGEALAPGINALGQSTEIRINEKILRVQAAAVHSIADKRVGTIITLRDISADVEQEARRDALIDEIASDVHVSMTQRAQAAALEARTKPRTVHDDTMADFARELARDAGAVQRMIADYRDLTLLRPDALRERLHPVNVTEIMLNLAEEWRPSALASGISLDVSTPDDDIHVPGDEKRLLWALGSLVDNAIRYSGGKGQVQLNARSDLEASRVTFIVRDEGPGIAPDDQARVFERFFRAEATRNVPGTGQGLYFAARVIEAHGGQIALASKVDSGTSVTVTLPLTAEVALEIPAEEEGERSIWDIPTRSDLVAAPKDR
jgi:signal transduction histidine kinase